MGLIQNVFRLCNSFLVGLFRLFPINRRKIFFMSYYGAQYGCNPKYISRYISEHSKNWKIVWAFNSKTQHGDYVGKRCQYLSLNYWYHISTSRIIVTNYRMPKDFIKRKGQFYVQTWHSMLRLKKIEQDVSDYLPSQYIEMATNDSNQIDLVLSGCDFSTNTFSNSFWYKGEILQCGSPRCDILVDNDNELKNHIKSKLNLANKRCLLYAPTFRQNGNNDCYSIDFHKVVTVLENCIGGEWTILIRLHPHLAHYSHSILSICDNVVNVSEYDDVQELMMISDMLLSDYSSLIFDYMLTLRPCLLFVPDLEEYQRKERSLYFNIEELPFPICRNEIEFYKAIENFDFPNYRKSVLTFLTKVGSHENGDSSKKVLEYFDNHLL